MKRVLTAVILAPVVIASVILAPAWLFLIGCAAVGCIAFWEFETIAEGHGLPSSGWVAIALGVIWLAVPERMSDAVLVASSAILMGVFLQRRDVTRDLAKALRGSAGGVLGIVYIFG